MLNSLVEYVIETVDSKVYYQKQFPNWNGDFNSNVKCPFVKGHKTGEDKRPSLSVDIQGTGGAYCFSCDTRAASIIHYEKLIRGGEDEDAGARIYHTFIRPILASCGNVESHLQPTITALKGAPQVFKAILNDLKISKETVERFLLGFDPKRRRITIPIIDSFGQLLNIRYYALPSMRTDDKYPKIINADGYGKPAELFPLPKLISLCSGKHKPTVIYWFSGERDTLLAWDRGIPSFCYTTGENVCKPEWIEQIKEFDCEIKIVQDNDKTGEEGAAKRFKALDDAGVSVSIITLPGDNIKDFSDYIIAGGTVKDFLNLGDTENEEPQPEYAPRDGDDVKPISRIVDPSEHNILGEYQVADIGRTPKLLNKPITCRAIVSGKMDRTYSVPRIIRVNEYLYRIPISREMLQLIRENDFTIEKLLKHWINSTRVKITIVEYMTVTECEIIPMIQPGIDSPYFNQRCYFFQGVLECNKPYLMTIIPTTDMKTQETVGLITAIEPVSNILDSYSFTDKSCELLTAEFGIDGEDSYNMLRQLAELVSTHHTHIYNRNDLHICALLTWICPLQFEFPCEGIKRGWLNTLVLGDTETGKSEVCQKLTKLLHCGVFISAESCSYVGLVGGAVKSANGGLNILRWGKIPLYNRQLVVIEELSGLSTFDISHMSEIRSAGIARYDKAGLSGETQAKTRLICLSNVRGESKSLGDYNTGVQAAQGLVGQNEDLARFDLILTATDDEVEGGVINHDRTTEEKKSFSSVELGAFRELVMFAWSLKPDQIEFTIPAYRACLAYTLKMVGEYHSSLPVFKSGSGRLKLARIALAIATIQFSWDNKKKKLIVTEKHVEAATKVLHHLFRKPSFGYARYSKIQFNLQRVLNEPILERRIKETFKEKEVDFYSYVSHSLGFTKFDMAEALGVHHMYIERTISQMFLSNVIKKGLQRSEWVLSRAGRKWIDGKLNQHATV